MHNLKKPYISKYSSKEQLLIGEIALTTGNGNVLKVDFGPSGFISDLTTCPSFLDFWLNDLDSPFPYAAIFHDAAMQIPEKMSINDVPIPYGLLDTRKKQDEIYLYSLLALGVNPRLSLLLYSLVRLWSMLHIF